MNRKETCCFLKRVVLLSANKPSGFTGEKVSWPKQLTAWTIHVTRTVRVRLVCPGDTFQPLQVAHEFMIEPRGLERDLNSLEKEWMT
jgi:hypothetical protein